MDILTHTITGLATGTVFASFSNRDIAYKLKIIGASGMAAALPDLDAISLWSGFDGTFGDLFNLSHSGRHIYSAKLWYSHHSFFHSLAAAIFFTLLTGFSAFIIRNGFRQLSKNKLIINLKKNKLLLFSFVTAYTLHLLEDMPTPAASWGGVRLFWPLKTYIGGSGDIWWWNNYDIFLIVCSVFILNLGVVIATGFTRGRLSKMTIFIFAIGFSLSLIQIKSRTQDFAYSGSTDSYYEFEIRSKELQKEILGKRLYNRMEKLDQKLKFYF